MLNTAYPDTTNTNPTTHRLETGMQNTNLQTIRRLEKQQKHPLDPTIYKPETVTTEDLRLHMKTEQYLTPSTIEKTLRYLRYMETHTGYPLDLRNPTETEIIRHLRYRLYFEDPPASIEAVRHEKLAINRYLRALGKKPIEYKLPPKIKQHHTLIPLPDTVKEFWHHHYDKRRPIRKLYQYMMFTGFMIGMRAPSEIANLRTHDIQFNKDGTATIIITETKKHDSKRVLLLPKEIATDPRHKSLRNWLQSWRPRLAKENTDALYVTVKGKDWNHKYLGRLLGVKGKQVWPHYHPYTMRHWSCTARMIQSKIQTGAWDIYAVQSWHGHETISSTEKYIRTAQQYIQSAGYDWIQRSLTESKDLGFGERPQTQMPTREPVSVTGERMEWARRHPEPFLNCFSDRTPLFPFFFLFDETNKKNWVLEPPFRRNKPLYYTLFFSILTPNLHHARTQVEELYQNFYGFTPFFPHLPDMGSFLGSCILPPEKLMSYHPRETPNDFLDIVLGKSRQLLVGLNGYSSRCNNKAECINNHYFYDIATILPHPHGCNAFSPFSPPYNTNGMGVAS